MSFAIAAGLFFKSLSIIFVVLVLAVAMCSKGGPVMIIFVGGMVAALAGALPMIIGRKYNGKIFRNILAKSALTGALFYLFGKMVRYNLGLK